MTIDSNNNDKSPGRQDGEHVDDNEAEPVTWDGTIQHVRLSLMKTGIFQFSDTKSTPAQAADRATQSPKDNPDEEADVTSDDSGMNPYDSTAR